MKSSLTKLLLALSLVVSPVTVLASDFHDVGMKAKWTIEETKCETPERQNNPSQPAQHDSKNCEMPCCENSECTMQGICIVQYSSYFIAPKALKINHSIEYRGWIAYIAAVPKFELPPDNPPPIDL